MLYYTLTCTKNSLMLRCHGTNLIPIMDIFPIPISQKLQNLWLHMRFTLSFSKPYTTDDYFKGAGNTLTSTQRQTLLTHIMVFAKKNWHHKRQKWRKKKCVPSLGGPSVLRINVISAYIQRYLLLPMLREIVCAGDIQYNSSILWSDTQLHDCTAERTSYTERKRQSLLHLNQFSVKYDIALRL